MYTQQWTHPLVRQPRFLEGPSARGRLAGHPAFQVHRSRPIDKTIKYVHSDAFADRYRQINPSVHTDTNAAVVHNVKARATKIADQENKTARQKQRSQPAPGVIRSHIRTEITRTTGKTGPDSRCVRVHVYTDRSFRPAKYSSPIRQQALPLLELRRCFGGTHYLEMVWNNVFH